MKYEKLYEALKESEKAGKKMEKYSSLPAPLFSKRKRSKAFFRMSRKKFLRKAKSKQKLCPYCKSDIEDGSKLYYCYCINCNIHQECVTLSKRSCSCIEKLKSFSLEREMLNEISKEDSFSREIDIMNHLLGIFIFFIFILSLCFLIAYKSYLDLGNP